MELVLQKKNQNIYKSFKKCQFFCTNTYAYSLSMYKFSVTNLIICMLHKKDKYLTQIQQRKSLFQSVYLSFLYTSHMNTYVYENLYTYTSSICLHENIFSDFFELWKRYFGWEMYIELSGARPLQPLFAHVWHICDLTSTPRTASCLTMRYPDLYTI